jgi:hypothetical protein
VAIGASAQQKKTTAAAPSKPPAQKTAAMKTVVTKTPARKTAATKTTSSKGTASRRNSRNSTPRQLAPTSDRYREIQDALASKGYLSSPGTGVWDQQSMDAMKRFQQDQKLEPTGKLTARSLTALGLNGKQPESGADPATPMSSLNLPAGEPAPLH